MRAVVQRVGWAKVEVDGAVVGEIGRGLLVYLGVGRGDGPADGTWLVRKILGLRVFANDAGKFDRSVLDVAGSLLVVSQFTLYADVSKGRRPSFDAAMLPADAERAYEAFVAEARASGTGLGAIATGRFGADMRVSSCNEGPVTIAIDSAQMLTLDRVVSDDGEDLVFDTLWGRVVEAWADDKTHAAFLDYALRQQKLPEAAGRYRTLRDDPERGELAKKKMGAIILAAESLLASTKTPRVQRMPWQVTASGAACIVIVLFWMAYAFFRR